MCVFYHCRVWPALRASQQPYLGNLRRLISTAAALPRSLSSLFLYCFNLLLFSPASLPIPDGVLRTILRDQSHHIFPYNPYYPLLFQLQSSKRHSTKVSPLSLPSFLRRVSPIKPVPFTCLPLHQFLRHPPSSALASFSLLIRSISLSKDLRATHKKGSRQV